MNSVADGLIESAERSVALAKTHPIEVRRALSASYYAVYHALACAFADALIGSNKEDRPNHAWTEVYRGLDHSNCATACALAVNKGVPFPESVMNVAGEFEQLQKARHTADYDPSPAVESLSPDVFVRLAKDCLKQIRETPKKDILAFAAWVLITSKGAKDARRAATKAPPQEK